MESKLPLEKELEPIFLQKFPPFSESVKEFLVQYGPYIILVLSVIGVLGLLTALGVGGAVFGMGGASVGIGFNFYLGIVLGIVTLVMYLMAFTPLKARKRAGWNLLYYALLLGLVSNLIQLSIFAFIVGGLVGFWVLFQIREKYA
ncbi:hypothetical protein [Dyadobacter fermentans]|uniref:Chromate transporter n=1 Tax=Dyadobacter fermentans (strain ATCC 700827 / DSM 18053 / CIP 107007 / KCTC 52180 / NS114) TaxID=471854 RepID=C6W6V3_DYAFD|nr:hypothetical protein [Dyadobacter fermentans]ACT96164.1 conserved hypothetical protein [Dyadobacter fermentans DSM 18053]